MKNTTIIVADIDGPIISGRTYLHPKADGLNGNILTMTGYKPDILSVNILRLLVEKFDPACVVFNSTWNNSPEHLREELLTQMTGLEECLPYGHFNERCMTGYPHERNDRLLAIQYWLKEYADGDDTNWVAFDDAFLDHPRAIRVDPEVGISMDDYRKATKILGAYDPAVVLF